MGTKIIADFENIDQATIAINAIRSRQSCKGVTSIRVCTKNTTKNDHDENEGFFSNLFLSSTIQNGIIQNGIIQNEIVQSGVVTYPLNFATTLEYEQRSNDFDHKKSHVEVFAKADIKSIVACLRSHGGLNVKEIEKK